MLHTLRGFDCLPAPFVSCHFGAMEPAPVQSGPPPFPQVVQLAFVSYHAHSGDAAPPILRDTRVPGSWFLANTNNHLRHTTADRTRRPWRSRNQLPPLPSEIISDRGEVQRLDALYIGPPFFITRFSAGPTDIGREGGKATKPACESHVDPLLPARGRGRDYARLR